MFPQDEPVAIEVKILERKKVKLLSELERLERVKTDKIKDASARSPAILAYTNAQSNLKILEKEIIKAKDTLTRYNSDLKTNRANHLDLQKQLAIGESKLQEKKKELADLVLTIENTKTDSEKHFNEEYARNQEFINTEKQRLKNKDQELGARIKRVETIKTQLHELEIKLNEITEKQRVDKITISIEQTGLISNYKKLTEREEEIEIKEKTANKNLQSSESIKLQNKRDQEELIQYINTQKELIDKEKKQSEGILSENKKQQSILKAKEKTVNIKEEELKNKEIYLLDKERTLVRSAREIELKQSKYG